MTSICVIVSFVISDLSDARHSSCASLPANENRRQTSHRSGMIRVCKQFENTDDTAPNIKNIVVIIPKLLTPFLAPKERVEGVNRREGLHGALWIKNTLTSLKMPFD